MHFSTFYLLIDCGWWPELLLPLLLLSWFLGWLLRGGGRKYKDRIESLETDLRKSTAKNTGLDKEISGLRFDYDKMSTENKDLRNNLADSNGQINQWRSKFTSLEAEKSEWESTRLLNSGHNAGPSQDDLDRLQSQLNDSNNNLAEAKRKFENLNNDLVVKNREIADLKNKYSSFESKLSVAEDKLTATEKALAECEAKNSRNISTSGFVSDTPKDSSSNLDTGSDKVITPMYKSEAPAEKKGMGAYFESSNLQIIEGVGPKIEGILKAAGYNTLEDIANSDIKDLQKVLDNAGPRYRIHNPQRWSDQAKFAANDQWDRLIQYQKDIDGGDGGHSKAEKLYFRAIGFAASKPTDLKVVEGIGPKIEGLLKAAGINSWSELAGSPVSKIQEILSAAGDRYRLADPKTWPKQAELAAAGKWTELKEYQDFLNGGKE